MWKKIELLLLFSNSRSECPMHEFMKCMPVRPGTLIRMTDKLSGKAEVCKSCWCWEEVGKLKRWFFLKDCLSVCLSIYFDVCLCVCVCTWICTPFVCGHLRWLEERARFHAARVTESFELPAVGAGNKIWAFWKNSSCLSTEPYAQPCKSDLSYKLPGKSSFSKCEKIQQEGILC